MHPVRGLRKELPDAQHFYCQRRSEVERTLRYVPQLLTPLPGTRHPIWQSHREQRKIFFWKLKKIIWCRSSVPTIELFLRGILAFLVLIGGGY